MVDLKNRWAATMATGGNPLLFEGQSSFPMVASADGKFSIVCLSHQLRVYFLQTRQCIRTVDLSLQDTISVFLDPENSHQVIVFSQRGVRYVNWSDKVQTPVVATQTFSPPIRGLKEIFKITSSSYYGLAHTSTACSIYKIDKETAATSVVFEMPSARHAALSANGHQLATVSERSVQLHNISAAFEDSANAAVIANTRETFACNGKSTCVAVSNSGVIAVGLASGAISLSYAGTATGQPQRTFRWHIDPVMCLTFSADEVYLVSGGNEKVLVFWHVDSQRTQFLPRLSGAIDRVFVDANRPDHYSMALRVYEGPQWSQSHELLTISAVDLVSRLSVSPVCPNYKNSVDQLVKSARRSSIDAHKLRTSDLTAPVFVHPSTKHLYFARGSSIQAYDAVKGEQAFVQHAAPQLSTGRVKSEHMIADPVVSEVAFTPDGLWMATFDSMPTSNFDNLMSKNDVSYALKFWRHVDSGWTLASKVVDPHGPGKKVGCMLSCGENSFTTVDSCGGVRLWKPRSSNAGASNSTEVHRNPSQNVWTLRRSSAAVGTDASVSACCSPDKSLLLVSHDSAINVFQPNTLHRISFALPLMDSPVESLTITGPYLVIASSRRIVSFDLVAAQETAFCVQVSAQGTRNLCAVDPQNQLVALACNDVNEDYAMVRGRLLLFRPDSLLPIWSCTHPAAIASVTYTPAGFIFIDTDSRIGTLAPEVNNHLNDATDDLVSQMNRVLDSAQAAANVMFSRPVEVNGQADVEEDTTKWSTHRQIDVSLLSPIFTHTDGVSLESLFDRITRLVQ